MEENNVFIDLQEYVLLKTSQNATKLDETNSKSHEFKWSPNETRMLIDLYGKYKKKLGTWDIKNTKMLWDKIAAELCKINIIVTPNHCNNRWRVLERNYKRFVDDQNKTGRGRKYFEYQNEMEEIFQSKRNIYPEITLTASTVDIEMNSNEENIDIETKNIAKPKSRVIKKKTTTAEKLRLDRKEYYNERLKIEYLKLEQIKRRNMLIEERNILFKEKNMGNCKCNTV